MGAPPKSNPSTVLHSEVGTKKRHHQVPKFLLKQFAVNGEVVMVPRHGGRRTVSITSVAVQEHFYSFEDGEGNRITELEDYLADEVDGPAAPAIKRIVSGTFTADDLAVASRFVAFQLVRSPRFRHLDQLFAESVGPILAGADAVSAWRKANTADGAIDERVARRLFDTARAAPPVAYTPVPDRNRDIRILLRTAERLLDECAHLEWALAVTSQPSLCMSDSPAVIFSPTVPLGAFPGFRAGGANEIRLPLSPRHLLLGAARRIGPDRFTAPKQLIVTTNHLLAHECRYALIVTPGVDLPGDPRPSPQPPGLPEPTITLAAGDAERVTTPSYPPIRDSRLRKIVDSTER